MRRPGRAHQPRRQADDDASIACDVGRQGEDPQSEWIGLVAFASAGDSLSRRKKGDIVHLVGNMTLSVYTDSRPRAFDNHE